MSKHHRVLLISLSSGVFYGLLMRAAIFAAGKHNWIPSFAVMSIAFVFVVPFAMGYLVVAFKARETPVGIAERIFLPWVAVLLSMLGCFLAAWEGSICIILMTPIALGVGSIGGLIAGYLAGITPISTSVLSLLVVAMLPFLVGATERRLEMPTDIRSVESSTIIQAPAQVIWRNIERVPRIQPSELPPAWNRKIGFPAPIEATLSREGLGGLRHATFAGNVLFIETIDEWVPGQRLGFSIQADSENIPPSTLDEHVTVGGTYFDVLHGEYSLEPVGDGRVRLRLVSRHRVSTDFNWYARLWTDAVMQDVQKSILYVIKNRCEKST